MSSAAQIAFGATLRGELNASPAYNHNLQVYHPQDYVIIQALCLMLALADDTLLCCSYAPSAKSVKFMVFGDPAERDAYQKLVQVFDGGHPDIGIELTHIPSPSDYRVRLATEFAAGSPPDIMLMNDRRFAAFAANELLEPLGPYLEQSELIEESDFYPITIESFRWDGVLTCIPKNSSSLVVYYKQALSMPLGCLIRLTIGTGMTLW